MPTGKVKPYRRRRYGRRRYSKKRSFPSKKTFGMNPRILPLKFATTLKYVQNVTITNSVVGICNAHTFRANSIYDPDFTGTGHQPRGTDQFLGSGALYEHFTVVGSKIRVRFNNTNATTTALCGIWLREASTFSTTKSDNLEVRTGRWKQLPPSNNGVQPVVTTMTYSPKFSGIAKPWTSNTAIRGLASGNPSIEAYYHVWVCAQDDTLNIGAVNATVEIEYAVVFSEPYTPAES